MSWIDHLRPGIAELAPSRPFDYGSRHDLVRMDCNEAPFAVDDRERAELCSELGRLALERYPEVSGASLRHALADRWHVDPQQILLGNGSVEMLALLATAFGGGQAGRPAKLIYPDPSFPYYEVIARTHGVSPIPIALEADFKLAERPFADAIDEHTPALAFFASPNNPSGNVFDAELLLRLARRMAAVFVVDEAYVDFAQGGRATLIERVRDTPGLFVTRSLSKFGFAGLRIGALIGARDAIEQLDKVRLPWNVNTASLAFARALLSHPERIDARVRAIIELRGAFEAKLRAIPELQVFSSQANFILVRAPISAERVFERLLASGILVKNVSRAGLLDRCLRITVGTSTENERCAQALCAALRPGRA
jgi:histidinol-phosphate aminotransferase